MPKMESEKIDCLCRPCSRPAPRGKIESVRTHSEVIEQFDSLSLLELLFLVRKWHCWSRKAFPRQMTPQSRGKTAQMAVFRHRWQAWKVVRSIAAVRQRPRTPRNRRCSFAFFEFETFLWHFNKNSVQRWSSDFQGLFRVKIRKMAQGSDDLSTLPLSKQPEDRQWKQASSAREMPTCRKRCARYEIKCGLPWTAQVCKYSQDQESSEISDPCLWRSLVSCIGPKRSNGASGEWYSTWVIWTFESLTTYVTERSKNIGVRCPEVFNGKVFPPQTDTGTYCARITVDEESAEALADRSFWPRPLYVRPWKFNRKQQRGRPDNVQSTSGIDQQPPASAPDTQPSGQWISSGCKSLEPLPNQSSPLPSIMTSVCTPTVEWYRPFTVGHIAKSQNLNPKAHEFVPQNSSSYHTVITIGHLNINHLRYKMEEIREIIIHHKLNSTYPWGDRNMARSNGIRRRGWKPRLSYVSTWS